MFMDDGNYCTFIYKLPPPTIPKGVNLPVLVNDSCKSNIPTSNVIIMGFFYTILHKTSYHTSGWLSLADIKKRLQVSAQTISRVSAYNELDKFRYDYDFRAGLDTVDVLHSSSFTDAHFSLCCHLCTLPNSN